MPMKRRISKQRGAISAEAIRLFDEMQGPGCRCTCSAEARRDYRDDCPGCRRWWELHPLLRRALNEKMWNFPTISREAPDRRRRYEPDSEEARWLMLEAASNARREAQRAPPVAPAV
jgi:hypothetical protein